MAKEDTKADKSAEAVTQKLVLDEFCARLSETVKSPELIGAFHHSERASGVTADTEAEFKARYDNFINKPV